MCGGVSKRTMHCSFLFHFLTSICLCTFHRQLICTFNTIIKWCLCMRARLFFLFIFLYLLMFRLLCNWKRIELMFIVLSSKRSHRGNEKRDTVNLVANTMSTFATICRFCFGRETRWVFFFVYFCFFRYFHTRFCTPLKQILYALWIVFRTKFHETFECLS